LYITIGIDPSLVRTGFASYSSNGEITCKALTAPKGYRGAERLTYLYGELQNCLDHFADPITRIAIEGYSYMSVGRIAQLGELGGVFRMLIYKYDPNFLEIPPTQLKKFMTGKGQWPKDLGKLKMIEAANKLLKDTQLTSKQSDEADAVALAYLAHATTCSLLNLSRSQMSLIQELRNTT